MLIWHPPHQLRQVLKVIMNVFLAIHDGMSQSRLKKKKIALPVGSIWGEGGGGPVVAKAKFQ